MPVIQCVAEIEFGEFLDRFFAGLFGKDCVV